MESVEDFRFIEDSRCGRIQILWFASIDDSTRKANGVPGEIRNWENKPSEEFVTVRAHEDSGIHDILFRHSVSLEECPESPGIAGVSYLELLDRVFGKSSPFRIGELFTVFGSVQLFVIPIRRQLICFVNIRLVGTTLFVKVRLQLHSHFFRENLHCLSVFDFLNLRKEFDWSAPFSA